MTAISSSTRARRSGRRIQIFDEWRRKLASGRSLSSTSAAPPSEGEVGLDGQRIVDLDEHQARSLNAERVEAHLEPPARAQVGGVLERELHREPQLLLLAVEVELRVERL